MPKGVGGGAHTPKRKEKVVPAGEVAVPSCPASKRELLVWSLIGLPRFRWAPSPSRTSLYTPEKGA